MRVFLMCLLKEPMPNFIDYESILAQKTPGTSTLNKSLGNSLFSNPNSEFLNSIGKNPFLWRRDFNGRTIFWMLSDITALQVQNHRWWWGPETQGKDRHLMGWQNDRVRPRNEHWQFLQDPGRRSEIRRVPPSDLLLLQKAAVSRQIYMPSSPLPRLHPSEGALFNVALKLQVL